MLLSFTAALVISGNSNAFAQAPSSMNLGDYVQLGAYNGNNIVWRYVGEDENGKMLLSDKIVCYKSFDASGIHKNSTERKRSSYGSNLWSQSNIRCWLNSETERVVFSYGAEPTEKGVWNGAYPYDSESGFLYGFNETEKAAIKSVNLKTKLNDTDTELSEGEYDAIEFDFSGEALTVKCKYQTTSDKLFLLDEKQLLMVKDNFKDNYYAAGNGVLGDASYSIPNSSMSDICFMRSPNTYEKASDAVCNVRLSDGEIHFDKTISAYMACAIRPAFYISDNAEFIGGTGKMTDPFVISNESRHNSLQENPEKKLNVVNADGSISVYADGAEIAFTDAKPFIDKNNRTQIPIRAVSEGLGYKVNYDDKTKTVSITGNDKNIRLVIGENKLLINGNTVEMDTAAQIVNERTYIPLRFVAQALGYVVDYSEPLTGFSVNENGVITLNTEHGAVGEIKDLY